ncbi:MAG: peptide deformylase [Actinomycetota bacterium]|nr:peptide deformylase [Actinomycetota bacterium]
MPVRPVLVLPSAVLTRPSSPIGEIDDAALALAQDLVDTMRSRPACVGVAAPQIGVRRRAFAVDVTGHRKARSCAGLVVLFDPEVLVAEEPEVAREGCLSVPDLTGDVARATRVVVRGRTPAGEEQVIEADAFEARALLHEVDHLDGRVFLDRVASHTSVFRRKVYR